MIIAPGYNEIILGLGKMVNRKKNNDKFALQYPTSLAKRKIIGRGHCMPFFFRFNFYTNKKRKTRLLFLSRNKYSEFLYY